VSATGAETLEVKFADLAAEDRRDILAELRLPSENAEARTVGTDITAELAWVECIRQGKGTTTAHRADTLLAVQNRRVFPGRQEPRR
jgi:hypothetical protein